MFAASYNPLGDRLTAESTPAALLGYVDLSRDAATEYLELLKGDRAVMKDRDDERAAWARSYLDRAIHKIERVICDSLKLEKEEQAARASVETRTAEFLRFSDADRTALNVDDLMRARAELELAGRALARAKSDLYEVYVKRRVPAPDSLPLASHRSLGLADDSSEMIGRHAAKDRTESIEGRHTQSIVPDRIRYSAGLPPEEFVFQIVKESDYDVLDAAADAYQYRFECWQKRNRAELAALAAEAAE